MIFSDLILALDVEVYSGLCQLLDKRLAVLSDVLIIFEIAFVHRPLADGVGSREFFIFWPLVLRIELVEGVAEGLRKAGVGDSAG